MTSACVGKGSAYLEVVGCWGHLSGESLSKNTQQNNKSSTWYDIVVNGELYSSCAMLMSPRTSRGRPIQQGVAMDIAATIDTIIVLVVWHVDVAW
jgi:hypothetical protein